MKRGPEEVRRSRAEALQSAERASLRAANVVHENMKRGLASLATITSTAPWIGVLGTLVGIFGSFRGLGTEKLTAMAGHSRKPLPGARADRAGPRGRTSSAVVLQAPTQSGGSARFGDGKRIPRTHRPPGTASAALTPRCAILLPYKKIKKRRGVSIREWHWRLIRRHRQLQSFESTTPTPVRQRYR